MHALITLRNRIVDTLEPAGDWVALLLLRLLMAYEYGRAGLMKFNGTNWFANVQDNFPFPFNVIPRPGPSYWPGSASRSGFSRASGLSA